MYEAKVKMGTPPDLGLGVKFSVSVWQVRWQSFRFPGPPKFSQPWIRETLLMSSSNWMAVCSNRFLTANKTISTGSLAFSVSHLRPPDLVTDDIVVLTNQC